MAFDPYATSSTPGDPSGGIPPDLLAQLGGGGEPPLAEEPLEEPEEGGDPVSILQGLVADMQHYLDVETDEEDKAKAIKAMQTLQELLATNQKQSDTAMGVTDVHKFMRRQAG